MIEVYAELKRIVEAAGFFTTFQPIDEPGDRMVCASHHYASGPRKGDLHGNSFWVAKRGADWFIAGWASCVYRVPQSVLVPELCLQLLRRERGGAYADFDEQVLRDFALVAASDEEFDGQAGQ